MSVGIAFIGLLVKFETSCALLVPSEISKLILALVFGVLTLPCEFCVVVGWT